MFCCYNFNLTDAEPRRRCFIPPGSIRTNSLPLLRFLIRLFFLSCAPCSTAEPPSFCPLSSAFAQLAITAFQRTHRPRRHHRCFLSSMSARYWSKTCEAALAQEGTKHNETILLGTHGFTVACFIIGIAFTGYWVLRWTIIKRSDPEKLANAWRWLGPFLGLSFSCCIFGAAAWISKINLISSQIRLFVIASSGAIPPCRSSSALQKQANESQCIYRIAYALEFMCLFLSIVISLDRISEQAGSARGLSGRILAPLTNSPPPPRPAAVPGGKRKTTPGKIYS